MSSAPSTTARSRRERRLSPAAADLLKQFPPRAGAITWPAAEQLQEVILDRLLQAPFVMEAETSQSKRRVGLRKILAWLEHHPGDTWQERWIASGADAAGNIAWRHLAMTWLQSTGWSYRTPKNDFHALGSGLLPLISGDVIRPSPSWLLTPGTVQMLTAEMARSRDPEGFAALAALCQGDPANYHTKDGALRRIATLMAAKGGRVRDITVGDCVELAALLPTAGSGSADTSAYFYQLLHALDIFPRRLRRPCASSPVRPEDRSASSR